MESQSEILNEIAKVQAELRLSYGPQEKEILLRRLARLNRLNQMSGWVEEKGGARNAAGQPLRGRWSRRALGETVFILVALVVAACLLRFGYSLFHLGEPTVTTFVNGEKMRGHATEHKPEVPSSPPQHFKPEIRPKTEHVPLKPYTAPVDVLAEVQKYLNNRYGNEPFTAEAMQEAGNTQWQRINIRGSIYVFTVRDGKMVGIKNETPPEPSALGRAPGPRGMNSAASPFLTRDVFNQIQPGMTYSDVVRMLGCDGEIVYESDSGGNMPVSEDFEWKGANGASITINFSGGRVRFKSHCGLR